MAENGFSSTDPISDQVPSVNEEGKTAAVDLWHAHPKQQAAAPFHSLHNKLERRRPENAMIRRWMELGDQALNQPGEQDRSRDLPAGRPKNPLS